MRAYGRSQPSYRPPHARGSPRHSEEREARSLADVSVEGGVDLLIKLLLSPQTASNLADCPFPLQEIDYKQESNDEALKEYTIRLPKEGDGFEAELELLSWFAKLATPKSLPKAGDEAPDKPKGAVPTDPKLALVFPSTMSKAARAHWHQMAEGTLMSESEGFGTERYLKITPRLVLQSTTDSCERSQKPLGSGAQRERARKIWNWCQAEGGTYWRYSQSEILQILTLTTAMPPDLAKLCGKRDMAQRLVDRLNNKDGEGALAMLEREESLAWIRDDLSGGYPLHIAAWQGLEQVVRRIIKQPTTIEQRDRQRRTPLQVARRRGHRNIEKLLLDAEATDPGTNIPPLKMGVQDDSEEGRATKGPCHYPPQQMMPSPKIREEDLGGKKSLEDWVQPQCGGNWSASLKQEYASVGRSEDKKSGPIPQLSDTGKASTALPLGAQPTPDTAVSEASLGDARDVLADSKAERKIASSDQQSSANASSTDASHAKAGSIQAAISEKEFQNLISQILPQESSTGQTESSTPWRMDTAYAHTAMEGEAIAVNQLGKMMKQPPIARTQLLRPGKYNLWNVALSEEGGKEVA